MQRKFVKNIGNIGMNKRSIIMKKVLITGANGYIGSHVVDQLCKDKRFEVIAVDFSDKYIDKNVKFQRIDILQECNDEKLYEKLGKPDICIHLAWEDGFKHNSLKHAKSLSAHFSFLENLMRYGTNHIAVAGSFREYGRVNGKVNEYMETRPDNMYCLAKLALKRMLELYLEDKPEICFQWLRPFTVYGDDERNDSIMSKIITWEKEGKATFPFTEGLEQYDYIHINEVAKQIVACISQREIQGVIDCCSGTPIALKDMIESFIIKNNFKIRPEYGAFKSREYDSPVIYGDRTKIEKILKNCNE